MTRSTDPKDRMGVYKSIDQVPPERRLTQYESRYSGSTAWDEYLEYYMNRRSGSDQKRERAERAWRSWSSSIDGRHPALALPKDVERWSQDLIDDLSLDYALRGYWAQIDRFYSWLLMGVHHPHTYDPFLIAANEFEAAGKLWNLKISRPRGVDSV